LHYTETFVGTKVGVKQHINEEFIMIKKIVYFGISILFLFFMVFLQIRLCPLWLHKIFKSPYLVFVLMVAFVFFLIVLILFTLLKRTSSLYFVLLLFLLSLPKLLIIFLLKLTPKSDMWTYDLEAKMRLAGYSWNYLFEKGWLDISNISPHVFHIASFFRAFYWLSGMNLMIIQLTNVVLCALCSYLIYSIVKFFFNNSSGLLASLLLFFSPSNYVYSCLIGAEYIQMFAILVSIYFYIRILDIKNISSIKRKVFFMILSLIALLIAESIRPNMIVYASAMFIFGIFSIKSGNTLTMKQAKVLITLFFCLFCLFSFNSNKIDRLIYQMPIANRSVETNYTLATGFNYETKGMYSSDIITNLEKINHANLTPDTKFMLWNHFLTKKRKDNYNFLKTHSLFWELFKHKLDILLDSRFGFKLLYFSFEDYFNEKNNILPTFYNEALLVFCFVYQQLLLLSISVLTLLSLIHLRYMSNEYTVCFFAAIVNIGVLLSSILVEVQPRYQMSMYVPWMLSIGFSYGFLTSRVLKSDRKLQEQVSHSRL